MKLPAKLANRVMFWDDERDLGNPIMITLMYGWSFDDDPLQATHVAGFDTPSAARLGIASARPCDCKDCTDQLDRIREET